MRTYHVVQEHDTLGKIAKRYGIPISDLVKLNQLSNPNRLKVGQKIALRKEAVCGFESLFLDTDRNPIKNLEYIFEFCGKMVKGRTTADGKTEKIFTDWPEDTVRIMVKRFDGTYKKITSVISGYGNKLCTLVSPLMVISTELKPHPGQKPGTFPDPKELIKPAYGPHHPAKATTDKKELGPRTKQTATPSEKPITVVEGDIPELDFLKNYTGELLTDADWQRIADELKCEVNAIRAVARVESSGAGFDRVTKRPIILYERHVFHEKSNRLYSNRYPDISSGKTYLRIRDKNGKVITERKAEYDKAAMAGRLAESDYYPATQRPNYQRLAKAIQLDRKAALMACSWGMFQIMGFNHAASGFKDVESFVKAMSTSEKEQMNAFLNFIKADRRLIKAVQEKDWLAFAIGYNGRKQEGYDIKMKTMYNNLQKSSLKNGEK